MKQLTDAFAQRTRTLVSEVQRLRDWAGGDPDRMDAVADALVELTAHRLSGHLWAEAAPGAQEAVTLAARLLARNGPVGPYTPKADAVRSVTSLVHLALIQSAAGLYPQAEQVLAAAFGLREQLSRLDLDAALDPRTVAWALLIWARVALAAGDTAAANARVDAALGVQVDDELLAIDLSRAGSDARWAAGHLAPAVEYALEAVERYETVSAGLLERPDRLPATMLERLSEPLFGLYSDAADRVLVIGAPGLSLNLRRRLVDLLGTLTVRVPDSQHLLVSALTDLAGDLDGLGRTAEAADLAELAASIAGELGDGAATGRRGARPGAHTSWTSLMPAEAFGVQPRPEPSGRLTALRGPADADEQARRAQTEAALARRADEASSLAAAQAEEAERHREAERRLAGELAERQRRHDAEAAERDRAERQRKRAERIAEHERQAERERAAAEAALRARVSDETEAERAEREELEQLAAELAALEASESLAQPDPAGEIAEAEAIEDAESMVAAEETAEHEAAADTERLAAQEAVREQIAADDAEDAEEARVEVERAERERAAIEEAERERAAIEEAEREQVDGALEQARSEVEQAAATGKRRDVREAGEALVGELRARYQAEPERYLDELLEALDQLAAARWQAGDWWGSRGPSKQAKALRKQHGR